MGKFFNMRIRGGGAGGGGAPAVPTVESISPATGTSGAPVQSDIVLSGMPSGFSLLAIRLGLNAADQATFNSETSVTMDFASLPAPGTYDVNVDYYSGGAKTVTLAGGFVVS